MISALPEDLLVQILSLIPTKDAITTMILSKRWHFVWTMLPKLEYKEIETDHKKSVWDYLDKSLQLHKAPSLESLHIQLQKKCPVDADVGKWVAYAVERYVQNLVLQIYFQLDPTSLPESFYTCKTLVKLTLVKKILIDVPSRACLPSLQSMKLFFVTYKDEDSQSRLLSSCLILRELVLSRRKNDNVTRFSVKVPYLQKLCYKTYTRSFEFEPNNDAGGSARFLVIVSPRLNDVIIHNCAGEHLLIEDMPRLDVAIVDFGYHHHNVKLMRSFSSVMFLDISKVPRCNGIDFPRLIELKVSPGDLDAVMLMLSNSPKLKVLMIDSNVAFSLDFVPVSWNQPSSVPGCLSHLEVFEWKGYEGIRDEKEFVKYILASSESLKTVGISLGSLYKLEMKEKIRKLESMYRISTSSQLLFSAQMQWRYRK